MQFLTCLSDPERDASLTYYRVALSEVHLRGKCISTIHRLLRLLTREKPPDKQMSTTVKRLHTSNASCEKLCYEVWIRLLELLLFLDRRASPNELDKTTTFSLDRLQNWRKDISTTKHSVLRMAPITFQPDPRCLSLNDRLLLRTNEQSREIGKVDRRQSEAPAAHDGSLESVNVPANDEPSQKNGLKPKTVSSNMLGSNTSNRTEINRQSHCNGDAHATMVTGDNEENAIDDNENKLRNAGDTGGYLPKPECLSKSDWPSLLTRQLKFRNGVLIGSSATGMKRVQDLPRSPASISHSEARKIISQMPTGSDIVSTFSPEAVLSEAKKGSSEQRVDSYLAAAETNEMAISQQHSNSNVDIRAAKLRKSWSADHLAQATAARAWSLDDLNGPQTDKTVSVSHSPDDTTTYPLEVSEHLTTFWDNYQAPYYSCLGGLSSMGPKANVPANLIWEDVFFDETEALDFESCHQRLQSTTRQIDEWSFDGLSCTPLSNLDTDDIRDDNDARSQSSAMLLEGTDKDPFSEDDAQPVASIEMVDKCLQTEVVSEIKPNGYVLSTTAYSNASLGIISQDPTTTHTSGYESGPDLAHSFFQRTSFSSVRDSNSMSQQNSLPHVVTHDSAVQTVHSPHNYRCNPSSAITEEPSEQGSANGTSSIDILLQSERSLIQLREFIYGIVVGTVEQNVRMLERLMRPGELHSQQVAALCDRWKIWLKWIHSRKSELQNLKTLQDRIHELSTKVSLLRRLSGNVSNRTSLLSNSGPSFNLQVLGTEFHSVTEEAENLRQLLLKQRRQEMNRLHFVDPDTPELSHLETQFAKRYNNLLDQAIEEACSLADQASSARSEFAYLESLTDRLQMSTPLTRVTTQSSDLDSSQQTVRPLSRTDTNHSSPDRYVDISNQNSPSEPDQECADPRNGLLTSTYYPLIAFMIVLMSISFLWGVVLSLERFCPHPCPGPTRPGWFGVYFHRTGIPPH
ncbi:unnamed protein product [Mesocestoides corti]|uniref:KASH domain-containing protein n=1 Tax=Mesocestoides corti TaxID=53468 RepID=A0A158QS48_MESCO|nr:unnamed protein product [Mesocestoides corti]